MATNHTGDPTETLSPASAPSLTSYLVQSCPDDGDDLDAASVGQALQSSGNLIAYLQYLYRTMMFGTGADGDYIHSSVALHQVGSNAFYDHITIGGGHIMVTNGWPIFARTSITVTGGAGFYGNGGNASGTTKGLYNGTEGGPHGSTSPSNAIISGSYVYNGSQVYGLGGNGGAGGGSSPSGTTLLDPLNSYRQYPYRFLGGLGNIGIRRAGADAVYSGLRYDALRGGGAGAPGEPAVTSGAGGAGGALVVLMSPSISLTNADMQSNGGNGSSGATNGNGGGGGGGGWFLYVCEKYTDGGGNTYSVTGGAKGNGAGGGSDGVDGSVGNPTPQVILIGP